MRKLTGSKTGQGGPIKDKNRKPLLTRDEQERRWVEHFKEMFNQPLLPTTFPDELLTPVDDLQIEVGLITMSETTTAIQALKNGKVTGLDEIAPEMVKYGGQDVARELTRLLNACWVLATVPDAW